MRILPTDDSPLIYVLRVNGPRALGAPEESKVAMERCRVRTGVPKTAAIVASAVLVLLSAIAQAGSPEAAEEAVRIVLDPEPQVFYAPEGLPALSDDARELAIVDAGDPNAGDAVAVLVVRLPERTILHRFDLLRSGETQDMTSERLPERVRIANEYLSARQFKPLPLLYELDWKYQTTPRRAIERFGLRIESEDLTGILTITDVETGTVGLRVRRPVKIVGPAEGHPHNHCWIQGQARQGWFDSASQLVLLRIVNTGGGHYCDLPDEWLIVHLH